jgi:hypothetical protein
VTTPADAAEPDETFTLSLTSPSGAVLAQTSATAMIVNRRKGDLNGDGGPDLLWEHTDGRLLAWLMNGTTATSWPELDPNTAGLGWDVVGMADFNDDGYQDLLQQHDSGALRVWAMRDLQRTSILSLSVPGESGTNWKIRGVGDFNADGKADIVWQHLTGDYVAVWLMNGLTLISSELTNPPTVDAAVWTIAGVADVNGDGKSDLVWQDGAAGWLAAWLMNGLTLIDSVSLTPPQLETAWKIRGIADLNGDGHPDLLWHHQTDDWVAAWLMSGTSLVSSLYLNPDQVDPAAWRLVGPR